MKPSATAVKENLKITTKSERKTRAIYMLGTIGVAALILTTLIMLSLWQAIFFGALIALTIHPIYKKLYRRTGWRRLSGALVCIMTLLIVFGPLLSLLGVLLQQFTAFLQAAPALLPQMVAKVNELVGSFSFLPQMHLSLATLNQYVAAKADTILQTISAFTIGQAVMWTDILTDVAIAFLVAYFALVDGPLLKAVVVRKFQVSDAAITDFIKNVRRAGRSILLGTVAAAAAQAFLIAAGFVTARLPGAVLAGAVTFAFAFIPLLGSWPVALAGVVLAFMMGMPGAAAIVTAFGVVAGLADNVVRIWVAKDEEHIHPLLVFLAILGGLELMGPLGVLFGPMLLTILYQLSDQTQAVVENVSKSTKSKFAFWKARPQSKMTRSKQGA